MWFGVHHYINEEFDSWKNSISIINESKLNVLPTKIELDSIISNWEFDKLKERTYPYEVTNFYNKKAYIYQNLSETRRIVELSLEFLLFVMILWVVLSGFLEYNEDKIKSYFASKFSSLKNKDNS